MCACVFMCVCSYLIRRETEVELMGGSEDVRLLVCCRNEHACYITLQYVMLLSLGLSCVYISVCVCVCFCRSVHICVHVFAYTYCTHKHVFIGSYKVCVCFPCFSVAGCVRVHLCV